MAKARFVSRYGNYSVGVQSAVREHFGTGESRELKKRIDANFSNKLVNENDLAVAVSAFVFRGLPEDVDTNEHISPRFRVSVWDSARAQQDEGWTSEEVDQIISALRSDSGYGQDHIEVQEPAAGLPFPGYDDLSEDEILRVLKLLKVDPEAVIAYERENANRDSLLKKLEGVEDADGAVVVNAG